MTDGMPGNGRSMRAQQIVAKYTAGASLKTKLVVVLKTLLFLNRRNMFFQGCSIPGPLRPPAMLFTLRMIPGKKIADTMASRAPVI